MRFTIAKKIDRAPSEKGVDLRSVTWPAAGAAGDSADASRAEMVVLADSYEEIRLRAAAFDAREQEIRLRCRMLGKSLKVTCEGPGAPDALMEFAGSVGFACEDARDCVDFYNKCVAARRAGNAPAAAPAPFAPVAIALTRNDFRLEAEAEWPEDEDPEPFYASIMPDLDRYGMGVVK